jgi:hypothetical protein
MRQADAAAFAHLLASHVDTLRNADVDPSEDALRALAEAGRQPAFIEVQRAIAREDLLPRIVHVARDMDIASARGVAMLACVALASSVDDGLAWVLSGIGPASTPALLDSALRAVGDADLEAFQRRMQIPATGALDVRTHARLTASLRALGPRSPIPVRSGRQALETLLRQAEAQGRGVVAKLASLWQSPRLADGEI